MSVVKMLGSAAVVWGTLATIAHADPINSGSTNWYFFTPASSSDSSDSSTSSSTSTPSSTSSAPTAAPSFSGTADAFINFGSGPYPEASLLTTGGAQPWYTSPSVEKFFNGQEPNAQQQLAFENAVLKDVQATYQLSGGLTPKLTIDPSVPANHTLSVVSHTSYGPNPNAIGITDVGNNGFGFIDKLSYASSLTDLQWAVAHNVSHELMHAFGVAVHHDQTGQYLDAASATWSMLTNPNTTFSEAAIQDIASHNYAPNPSGSLGTELIDGDQEILASPVPEPATVALWGLGALAVVAWRRRAA